MYLVCGLGSLGQYCVAALKEFGVAVSAIDIAQPRTWEVRNLPELLADLVIGDCRQPEVLERANIHECQAVLLVTSDERINLETAFAIRSLNAQVRLVVRSSEHDLNELIDAQLGNFAAFGANQLPAPTFAIAALNNEIQGLINLDDQLLRVVQCSIDASHRWCDRRLIHELNHRTRRVLSHYSATSPPTQQFYEWEPTARVQAGDVITYIELADRFPDLSPSFASQRLDKNMRRNRPWQRILARYDDNPRQLLAALWQMTAQQQTKRVAAIVGFTVLTLIIFGTLILKVAHPEETWLRALYVTGVMLLGSYDIVYGALSPEDATPLWMRFLNLSYMLAGTASIAVLYALLTESLLAAKFQLPNRRPAIPLHDHVVLVGLDRVGRQVASFLHQLKQPLVGVSDTDLESSVLPQMPLVVGNLTEALSQVNLATARSVVVTTDDEMTNLAIGLKAHAANPDVAIVIQTFEPDFSNNLAQLLPYANVLCAYSLAAEAYAAAAFGDHVLGLLRLNDQTVLIAEYLVQPKDALHGLLLAEVAYGYGVVPILHQKPDEPIGWMPTDDVRLEVGDRLVVLTTIESLHCLAHGEKLPRHWQIGIDRDLSKDAKFEVVSILVRTTGCPINFAHELINHSSKPLDLPLYKHQAQRIIRECSKLQIPAHLVALPIPKESKKLSQRE